MNKFYLMTLILFSCAPAREVVQIVNGKDGSNGHSLVSQYMASTELECDGTGGSRLDIYMDLDDSLTPSEGDLYQNSIVVCNGLNGANGTDGTVGTNGTNGHDGIAGPPGSSGPPGLNGNPGHDGVPGPSGAPGTPGAPGSNGSNGTNGHDGQNAHVTPKNVTGNCAAITTNYDAMIKNNTVEIYTAGKSCDAPYKVYVLTSAASTFWLSATELAVFVDPAGLRILNYL